MSCRVLSCRSHLLCHLFPILPPSLTLPSLLPSSSPTSPSLSPRFPIPSKPIRSLGLTALLWAKARLDPRRTGPEKTVLFRGVRGVPCTMLYGMLRLRRAVPEGIQSPVFNIINDTAVRVFWLTPLKPNGPIVAYYILVNDVRVDPHAAWPSSYDVAGLRPYTVYNIQVCTLTAIIY